MRALFVPLVRCPDGHTFFAFLHRAGPARERNMAAQALGPDGHTFFAFLRTTGPARERNMTAQALGPGDGLSHPEQEA